MIQTIIVSSLLIMMIKHAYMLNKLISNNENCVEITALLLNRLHVNVTYTSLKKALYDHPDYPSMLCISDVLRGYGVENIAFNSNRNDLDKIPAPFITVINSEDASQTFYTLILSVHGNRVKYYDPWKHKENVIDKDVFVQKWSSGIVLVANGEDARGEKNFSKMFWQEKRINAAKYIAILALPVLTVISAILAFVNYGASSLISAIFTVSGLLGTICSMLLIWYESDRFNPVVKQFCSNGKKINCSAILNSNASKIAGMSWSSIGFTYFMGQTLLLLLSGISNVHVHFITAWSTTLATSYVFFSIYYQARIAKQWCVLCLYVQAVLVLQLAMALLSGWHKVPPNFTASSLLALSGSFGLAYLFPFILITFLLPALHAAKENKHLKKELQQLKYKPEIFQTVLIRQKRVNESTEGLGIILGNPAATQRIIKVCNPYCKPCAKAHTLIEELLNNNNDVQLQILFMAKPDEYKAPPVRHFLAIAESTNETAALQKALNDWYLSEKKEYNEFAGKYPIHSDLKEQDKKIQAMYEWCNKTGVTHTPTLFLNGYKLPAEYTADDLKYFLSV